MGPANHKHTDTDVPVLDIRRASPSAPEPPSRNPGLFERLRERKVVQWSLAYVAMAWLVLQAMDILSDIWNWPNIIQQAVSLFLGFGTFPMLVVAWFHGEKGHQDVCPLEAALVAASVMGTAFAVWSICLGLVS